MISTIASPVKALCLHGCNQDKIMFESITKDFTKILGQANIACDFIEGKYDHPNGKKTWYSVPIDVPQILNLQKDNILPDDISTLKFDNYIMTTLNELDEYVTKNNITVLIGFSQGANVIDSYLAYKNNKIKCAVLFSGYSLVDPNRKKVKCPVLNVVSEQDIVVPCVSAPYLFEQLSVIKHDKGHKLPSSKPTLREICLFISKHL